MSSLNSSGKVKGGFIAYFLIFCLVLLYFILVNAVSPEWIDSSVGAMAFAVAKTINPYLMDRSIILAANPSYFVHCHVLASWLFIPTICFLNIKSQGGRDFYKQYWVERNKVFGSWWLHLIILVFLFGGAVTIMPYSVDIPTSKSARLVWLKGVSFSALIMNSTISLMASYAYMILYAEFKKED